ncbi:sugar phosphate isomerase/epimerase family protein [Radiobacillus sp. PE A8.2]|uniref:sugar phosphate isomerase/epimerase family protein n=1 Tax=Radiobacillus sp. PE A8.2 TaxID=3380349 RepID=UPI003890C47C
MTMTLNLGIRGHDIHFDDADKIAEEVAGKGLRGVQLALSKSFPELPTGDGVLSPGFAKHIGRAFHKTNVEVAVLGCYINMIHPNLDERKKVMDRFKEHIRYARDFGCSIVGSETGNIHEKMVYTEDNFEEKPFLDVVDSVRELVEEAEKFGVFVGIEGGINHPIHTPEKMKRLLDLVDSNNLQVIFDPANFISGDNFTNQEAIMETAFQLFGDRIVIIHAKDFVIEDNNVKMVPVGKGMLNYDFLFKWVKENKLFVQVLLEDTQEPFIDDSIIYLNDKYEKA